MEIIYGVIGMIATILVVWILKQLYLVNLEKRIDKKVKEIKNDGH